MALVYSQVPCVAAGTFTTNVVKAAPVKWDRQIVDSGAGVQAVVVNSGIANACTGEEGMGYCKETAEAAASKVIASYKNTVDGHESDVISSAVEAVDASGKALGYIFNITTSKGYGGDIQLTVGIQSDGTVSGYSVLSISETAGLGMKATEPSFYNQYVNKQADKFVVSKDGGDGEQIDALSGATITSRAVTGAVNAALGYYQNAFK